MITDMPILSMLRTRMQWHQERQRVLAENVANADMPGFQPRDLAPPQIRGPNANAVSVALARTDSSHIGPTAGAASQALTVRSGARGVNLEDEMIRVSENQMDYQAVTSLYSRSLGLLKIALARR